MAPYKRRKTWWTDFSVNGQRYRQSLHTKDWREAQARDKQLISQASEGKLAASSRQLSRVPFAEAANRYLEHRKLLTPEPTWKPEAARLKPLGALFIGLRINQITEDHVRNYQRHRCAAGRHPRTINHELKLLLRLLRLAKVRVPDVQMLPVPRPRVRLLSEEEKLRLYQTAASNPDWFVAYCAALLTANASLRPSELRSSRWRDVDANERTVLVHRSKTDAGLRVVPLNDEAWVAICALRKRAEILGTNQPDNFVFHRLWPKVDGTRPMSSWRSAWRSLRKAAGLPGFRYYDLRHQCVTEMLEAGVPEGVIREIVGHLDPAMTRWYSHPRLAAKRAAVEALSAVRESPALPEPGLPSSVVEASVGGVQGAVTSQTTSQIGPQGECSPPKSLKSWYARQDSNLRPLVPETNALSS